VKEEKLRQIFEKLRDNGYSEEELRRLGLTVGSQLDKADRRTLNQVRSLAAKCRPDVNGKIPYAEGYLIALCDVLAANDAVLKEKEHQQELLLTGRRENWPDIMWLMRFRSTEEPADWAAKLKVSEEDLLRKLQKMEALGLVEPYENAFKKPSWRLTVQGHFYYDELPK
jgi:hypothetical protein